MTFGYLQDLTQAARRDAAEYLEKMEQQVGEITIVAAQEAEDLRKALQEEKEKRKKMVSDISYLAENLEDIPMRQLRIQIMAIKGDEDMPYPQQIKRHPPTSPSVLPFVNAATQTDDEVELVDRYTRTHTRTHTRMHARTHACMHRPPPIPLPPCPKHVGQYTEHVTTQSQQIAHTYSKSQLAVKRAQKLAEALLYCTTHTHTHTRVHIHTHTPHTHTPHTHTHHRDLSDEGPNRVTATEEAHFKYKNMGAGPRRLSLPPRHDSPANASSSDTSLLDGPNAMKLPPLHVAKTTYPYESSSTASLAQAEVKNCAKKSGRRGRR